MKRALQIIVGVLVVVAVAGGSFYGGMVYGKGQVSGTAARRQGAQAGFFAQGAQGGQRTGQGAQGGTPRAGAPGGMLFGQVTEVRDGMLVVTDSNGTQTSVKVTDTTLIEKNASVTLTDLKVGETVMVSGSRGNDGAITARSVQVAPAGRFTDDRTGAADNLQQ
jgi:hypothetical protein